MWLTIATNLGSLSSTQPILSPCDPRGYQIIALLFMSLCLSDMLSDVTLITRIIRQCQLVFLLMYTFTLSCCALSTCIKVLID